MAGVVFSKASGVNDTVYGRSQDPIKAIIEQQVEEFQRSSCVESIFAMDTTDKYAEKYTMETSIANFAPVGEGGAYPLADWREGYSQTIEPDTWKNSFEVTQEMVEDALYGKIKQKAKIFTLSYNRTREMFAAAMIMGAMGESINFGIPGKTRAFKTTAADGAPFFSTAHTSITGGQANQSNLFANDFNYDVLCYAQARMQDFRDDDGNILGVSPDTIVLPNDAMLKKAVFNAIGAEGLPDNANNSMNFQYGLWSVVIWPYLNMYIPSGASSKPWILLDSKFNDAYYGAIWLDRIGLSVRSEIAGNDNNVWKGRARHSAGFNNWRAMCMGYVGSGGTDITV